jgi:predicted RNA binding protein YcfA (HicA-like mRNA interferase family)
MKITNSSEFIRALKKHGFVLHRAGSSHDIYHGPNDAIATVMRGKKQIDWRAMKNNVAAIKRLYDIDLEA